MAERRMTLVSVVVPTRDRSALLRTTLRSVLRQRAVDLEVIVVDEASTDDTPDVVAGFGDQRLRLLRNAVPQGPNAARNRGAGAAKGEWLAFVDDDDLWAPDKLLRQLRAAQDSGRDWAYAGAVNVNDRLEVIHGVPPAAPAEVVAQLPRHNPIPASASSVIVRRRLFESLGGFNEALRTCEEWDLWIRLARRGPPAWVRSPMVGYRMHPGNRILDVGAIIEGARMIEQVHGTSVDWGRLHRWIAQLCLRGGRRRAALGHYARAAVRGQPREVASDLSELTRHALRRRVGGPARPVRRRSAAEWEDEARAWIEELRDLDRAELDPEP